MKNLFKILFLLFPVLSFAQNGTTFAGKIGVNVGTVTPTERLKVNGSATITGALKFQNYGTGVLKTNASGEVNSAAILNADISTSAAIDYAKITGLAVDNIAALKLKTGVYNGQLANVLGYYTYADGGGGNFYWNITSTATDNGGTIIQVTGVPTGRWIKITKNNTINIKEFSAVGDGVVICTNAIKNSLAYLNSIGGGNLIIDVGTYIVDDNIVIPSNVNIVGATKWNLANSFNYISSGDSPTYNATKIKLKNNSNVTVFTFDSLCVNSSIKNLFIDGNKANQASGNGITFRNAKTKIIRGSNKIEEVYIYSVNDTGVVIRDKTYEIYLDKIYADRSGAVGVYVAGQDCSISNTLSGYNGSYGIEVTFGGAFRSYNCDVFGNILAGLYVHDVKSCRFIGLQSNGNLRQGVLIANQDSYSPSRLQFLGCSFFGNSTEFVTSAIRYAEFQITTPSGGGAFAITITNCQFGNFGGSTYCSYAISDTSPTKRVNSIAGCQFESTVYSTALFQNIIGIYQVFGCSDSVNGLINSIGTNLYTNTKVNNVTVATESIGYDYQISSYTIDPSKRFNAVNSNASPITVTLPLANTVLAGKEIIIRKHDSSVNAITVSVQGGNSFATGTVTSLTTQGQIRKYISDGISTWFNSN